MGKMVTKIEPSKLATQLAARRKRQHYENTYQILLGIAAGITLMLLFMMVVFPKPQQVAVVNVNKIVDEFVRQTADQNLEPEMVKQNVGEFGDKLESTLKKIAAHKNLLLLPTEAVITGAKDITPQVQRELSKAL